MAEAEQAKLQAKTIGNKIAEINAVARIKMLKENKSALDLFKKDLGSFTRFYEFMSQLVDYDDDELEKLSLYAYHLRPLLREDRDSSDVDLSDLTMTHYRLSKQKHSKPEIE